MLCLWTTGLSLRFPWTRSGVSPGTSGHGMLCLWTERLPFLPPRGKCSATGSKCSKPASEIGCSTCHGYRQPAVKLAAGLKPGRAGPADQCSSMPSVKLKVACVSAEAQTDTTFVRKGRPVVNFTDRAECSSDDDVPNCFHLGNNPGPYSLLGVRQFFGARQS